MSNFSSIGVSVYEITRDSRVTCPFPVWAGAGVHTETHEGRRQSRAAARLTAARSTAVRSAGDGSHGARSAAGRAGRGAGRLRAPPAIRALVVAAHRPRL